MRCSIRFFILLLAALAIPGTRNAAAQAVQAGQDIPPLVDIFASYGYVHSNIVVNGTTINLNGGDASVAYNWKRWLGFVGDVGVYHSGNVTANRASLTVSAFQGGPRFSWRSGRRVTPFVEGLFGAGHASGTLYTNPLTVGVPAIGTSTAFLLSAGGGADWRISPRFSVRMIDAEYLYSEFNNNTHGNRQNNVRITAGIVLNFGTR